MARLSRADYLKRYRQRLDASKRWRKEEGYDELWDRLVDLYRGKHFESLTGEDQIAVNIAFSTVNVIYPAVSVNHPKVSVMARRFEDDARATITEGVTNYWWTHHNFKAQARLAVKDFLIVGHGWLKTGYRYVEEEQELTDSEFADQFAQAKAQADDFAQQNPAMAGQVPTDAELAASIPDTKSVAVEDRPFVERVSFHDVYVNPEATSMYDITWIAQKVVKPIEEVRGDKRYSASARSKVQADGSLNSKWLDASQKKAYGDDIKRVTVWEFYDIKRGIMCVFADSGDDFLVDPQPMPYAFGHPFVQIRNYDVPDMFYPLGDLEALEGLQLELDKTRSQMMNHRKRYARKYLYKSRALSPAGINALESDIDGEMVEVIDDNIPLGEVVVPVEVTSLPPEFYNQSEMIEGDIDKVSGVNEYARGSAPAIRRTATEASIIQDAANSRAADKLSVIESSYSDVARRVVMLAQQFLTGEQVLRIMGRDGEPLWVKYSREDIQGEFDFEIEAGSTVPKNSQGRRQNATDLLNAVAPFLQMGIIDPVELLRYVLREGFEIPNPERFLQPQAPPQVDPATGQPIPPQGAPPGAPPAPGGPVPAPAAPPAPPTGGIPPDVLAQLQGQVGLNVGGGQ